jgi:hypothetical protein
MIAVVLKDGLGNQLFQYAAARSLAARKKTKLKLDISSYKVNKIRTYSLHHFAIQEDFITDNEKLALRARNVVSRGMKKLGMSAPTHRFHEKDFHYDPTFFDLPDNLYIEGYWQSEKYFLPIETIIRKEFVVKSEPDQTNKALLEQIKTGNSVSLHVRRGDYVTDSNVNSIHGVCSLSYYQQAVEYMTQRVNDPRFFIFSDDIDWVKQNLRIDNSPVSYMTHNGYKDYEDLRLMYSCKYNIVANSSFSWWGAWLNNYKDKIVIAPVNWFKSQYRNTGYYQPLDPLLPDQYTPQWPYRGEYLFRIKWISHFLDTARQPQKDSRKRNQ